MIRDEKGHVEDLSTLSKLDEHILLEELHERYKKDIIYTYVGDILIAVNPFKDVGIYGEEESKRYTMAKKSANPPHIFAVADMAFQSMLGRGGLAPADQCILISGESGAGKTESTKLIIKQLVELCHGNSQLEQQILQVNPLLEAFGNAQTQLNDNSSRFGKYIQLRFEDGHVNGAKISEYLLEKSRVVGQHEDEQNFHIFYYLLAGQTMEMSDQFNLKKTNDYRYLTNGNDVLQANHKNLQNHFKSLIDALDLVGFTDEEQQGLFEMVASVLHLGNVEFQTNDHDVTTVSDPDGSLRSTAKLLQVDEIELSECLTSVVTVAKGEYFKINYSTEKSEDCRDAVSKAIYGRIFGWIVNKINQLLAPPKPVKPSHQVGEIGILDIFGFEHFEKNSFEQACINLANEQLQFFFNQHIFKMEQEEYIREGIDWTEVPFVDNKPLLDLFLEKPIGILALLDEESLFPKATDQTFVQKLNQNFNKNPYYKKSQQTAHPFFTINHYAGQVTYDATQWLEKNRDTVPVGVMNLLKQSKNALVKTLFQADISRTGTLALQGRRSTKSRKSRNRKTAPNIRAEGKKKTTVGSQFKKSLSLLMEKMTKSIPIFVRCLKPNYHKKPGEFDESYINAQLLYTGMLETTKIRREGFAVRPLFQEFVERYKVLIHKYKMKGTAAHCVDILRSTGMTGWHVGKTKVFLKYWHIEQMSDALEKLRRAATQLQKLARGFLARQEYKRLRQEASRIAQEEALRVQQEIATKTRQEKLKDADKKNASIGIQSGGDTEMFTQGTQVEDGDSSESDGVLQDVYCKVKKNGKYGEPGTREATMGWFADTQVNHVISESGVFSEWFHGIITRRQAEKLLEDKSIGCFLIRVSESRFGYSLSFRVQDRCRHYMIDQLANGKFIIIGESKVHKTLFDLVKYYQKNQISNYSGYLKEPCGQQNGECNYIDLVSENVYHILEESGKTYGYHVPPAKVEKDEPPAIPPRNKGIYSLAQSSVVSRNRLLQNQKNQHT